MVDEHFSRTSLRGALLDNLHLCNYIIPEKMTTNEVPSGELPLSSPSIFVSANEFFFLSLKQDRVLLSSISFRFLPS